MKGKDIVSIIAVTLALVIIGAACYVLPEYLGKPREKPAADTPTADAPAAEVPEVKVPTAEVPTVETGEPEEVPTELDAAGGVTIEKSGTYHITGEVSDGSVKIKKGTADVTLILEDLDLTGKKTAPVIVGRDAEVTLYIKGTVSLTDMVEDDGTDDYEGACVKVKSGAKLVIRGDGTLNIDAENGKNGVKGAARASVTIAGGVTVNVLAKNNGVASDGEVNILGGIVNVRAGNDGIAANPEEDDTDSAGNITITAGTVTVSAYDDAIRARGAVIVGTEGENGPEVYVVKSHEGIEAAAVALYSGNVTLHAEDDGINAADGNLKNSNAALLMAGGTLTVYSDGDGVDSNGDVLITGGSALLYGAATSRNAAFDCDGDAALTGGSLLSVGMSNLADHPAGVTANFSGVTVKAGAAVEIRGEGGAVAACEAVKLANSVIFTSDKLAAGAEYALYLDGELAMTVIAG